jgi:hypothetical protein
LEVAAEIWQSNQAGLLTQVNGQRILSAAVDLYQWWSPPGCTENVVMDVRALSSSWGASTVWANRPSELPVLYGQAVLDCVPGWKHLPAAGLIQAWSDGSVLKYGLAVYADDMTVNGNYRRFFSWDNGSNRPTLTITYDGLMAPVQPVEQLSRPSVMQASATNALEYGYVDNDGQLWQGKQVDPSNFDLVDWTILSDGQVLTGRPALSELRNGRVIVAAAHTRGSVWTRARTAGVSSSWGPLADYGGMMRTRAAVAQMPSANPVVFSVDGQGQLWVLSPDLLRPGDEVGVFRTWRSLGAANLAGAPTVLAGRTAIELFGLDRTTGAVKVATYNPDGTLTAWTDLGGSGFTGEPAVVYLPGFAPRVFVRSADGVIVTKQRDLSGVWSSEWAPVSGLSTIGSPAAVLAPIQGRFELIARAADGTLWSTGETQQASGVWRPWVLVVDELGNPARSGSDPTALVYNDDRGTTWGFLVRPSNEELAFYSTRQPAAGLTAGAGASAGHATFARQVLPAPSSARR